jgi:hypothetical protein
MRTWQVFMSPLWSRRRPKTKSLNTWAQAETDLRLLAGAHRQVIGKSKLAIPAVARLVAGSFLTRFLDSILFGITAHDAVAFVAVPLCLVAIALLAGYLPARRATRVDPVSSLRYE